MDDFIRRGIFAFIGVSAGIFFIYFAMRSNGSAYTLNPAWQFILALSQFLFWVWVLLLVALAVGFISIFISVNSENTSFRQPEPIQAKPNLTEPAINGRTTGDNERGLRDAALTEKEAAAQAAEEEEEEEEARELEYQKSIQRELELKRSRSAEDAVNAAMDDF